MKNQNLIIYDFEELFLILKEVEEYLNFSIIKMNNKEAEKPDYDKFKNFIIISKKKNNLKNNFFLHDIPIKIDKLIENINVKFLKYQFKEQSHISLGAYNINLNSRIIFKNLDKLHLTEKEVEIILFLKKMNKEVKINQLQKEVWGYQSKLDTHTVETHIYRLRKKFNEKFNDINFIESSKNGYSINEKKKIK